VGVRVRGRVLIVAGSDSGGGAGIEADIKTVTALGGYAATAITALTAQNTLEIASLLPVDPEFVAQSMRLVLADIGADCIKTGMLVGRPTIETVARILEEEASTIPLVIDPVMVASSGTALLEADAVDALIRRLIPRARLVTPNVPEAERLTGLTLSDPQDMRRAGEVLLQRGARAVLVKGGHLQGEMVYDLLIDGEGGEELLMSVPRQHTRHTHGTGCTLASAIATGLAQGLALQAAVMRARDYLQEAIRTAPGFGRGKGPLNHTPSRP